MKLQLILSDAATAQHVADTLWGLGHDAVAEPTVPGLVVTRLADPADAPSVQRLAARLDHPAGRRGAAASA